MHAFQIQKLTRLDLEQFSGIVRGAVLGCLGAFDIAMMRLRTRTKQDTVPNYEGHAWCDSLERQVSDDIATCRRARF